MTVEFCPLLQAYDLDTFEKIMASPAGEIIRSFPGRNTVRLELKHPGGGVGRFYLKRYERGYLSTWRLLLRTLRWPGADDEAMREWKAAAALRIEGFNTALPVAVGQERTAGVVTRSFVMTNEIPDGVCAHDAVPTFTTAQRRAFARQLGGLARRFHAAGFVHKDFYLYHVFVAPAAARTSDFNLFLIDFQRVVKPVVFKARWRVKDLAALAYSALKVGVPRTDLARFFKIYRGDGPIRPGDKSLVRRILKRVRWLNQRQPKHDKPLI